MHKWRISIDRLISLQRVVCALQHASRDVLRVHDGYGIVQIVATRLFALKDLVHKVATLVVGKRL